MTIEDKVKRLIQLNESQDNNVKEYWDGSIFRTERKFSSEYILFLAEHAASIAFAYIETKEQLDAALKRIEKLDADRSTL